jgi:hypothetical protein
MNTRRRQRTSQVSSSRTLAIRRNRRRGYASDDEDDPSALRCGSIDQLGEDAKFLMQVGDNEDYRVILARADKLSPMERLMLPPKTFDKIVKADDKRRAKIRAAKKLEAQKDAMVLGLLQVATASLLQPREYKIIHVQDTSDLQRAVRDCWSLKEERGMDYVLRIVKWLGERPTNPIVWNALPDKEARDAWLAHVLP